VKFSCPRGRTREPFETFKPLGEGVINCDRRGRTILNRLGGHAFDRQVQSLCKCRLGYRASRHGQSSTHPLQQLRALHGSKRNSISSSMSIRDVACCESQTCCPHKCTRDRTMERPSSVTCNEGRAGSPFPVSWPRTQRRRCWSQWSIVSWKTK
jgi:hypothetical protein